MTLLVSLHFVVGLALVALGSRVDRRALLVGALAPAAVVVWLVTRIGDLGSGRVVAESTSWAPGLGLSVDLRLDGFAARHPEFRRDAADAKHCLDAIVMLRAA